ncbi:hypothetical protein [uncultured Bacteroides sp.]|uniref:hypothetical protein n=1 Tax=uncultured Bacteroides sp. TaxID=162156 RepID=UPI0025EEDF78|nr:hypothetical protein [uncultured Bacteroides sp.]
MKAFSLIYILLTLLLTSCSKYTIEDGSGSGMDVNIKFQKNAAGEAFDMEYPVRVFCTDAAGKNIIDKTFRQGDEMKLSLAEGEYGISAFVGMNEECYVLKKDIDGKQIVAMKDSSMSDKPLRAAHTTLQIDKQTDVNMVPAYVVASAEVEFTNIPSGVKSVSVSVSPVYSGYNISGGYAEDTQSGMIQCYEKDGKWISDQKFFFPVEKRKTTVSVSIDRGDKVDNYSYTMINGLQPGQPYKFTGSYEGDGGDSGNGLNMDGEFQISGWNMEEEIVLDLEDETPVEGGEDGGDGDVDIPDYEIETFLVDAIPSADVIWGPFYVWKSEKHSDDEAIVTIISPDQWFQKFEGSDALNILNSHDIDGMTGWRTFTKAEAEEFHKAFSTDLSELNSYLEENGHNIFYTENRYLCENGEYAFNIFGSTNIRPAGTTVKYYLRPIKTIKLKLIK